MTARIVTRRVTRDGLDPTRNHPGRRGERVERRPPSASTAHAGSTITVGGIRRRLHRRPPPVRRVPEAEDVREAAIALVVYDDAGGDSNVVLIERSHCSSSYPGEYAFPGGRLDEGETQLTTAQRELHEELAIATSATMVVRPLDGHFAADTGNPHQPVRHRPGGPAGRVAQPRRDR